MNHAIKHTSWLFVLITALLLSGCGRIQNPQFTGGDNKPPSDVTLEVELANPDSLTMGEAADITILLEQKGEPIEGASVEIEGNMNHAGMEPVQVEAEEMGSGQYQAALNWTMAGGWLITARATLPDGSTIEKVVEGLQVNSQ